MMDHLIDTDLSYEIDALWKTVQSVEFISKIIGNSQQNQMFSANAIHHIELPAWIKRTFILFQHINNCFDNFKYLFCTNLSTDLQNALYTELSDLYRGIHFQQESLTCSKSVM